MDEEGQQVDGVITGTRNLIPLLKMESYQITMRMKGVTREREWQTGESHLPREEGVSGLETVRLGGKELGGVMMGGGEVAAMVERRCGGCVCRTCYYSS